MTFEDVRRLDYSNVIFQTKNLLTPEETVDLFTKVFGETESLPQTTSLLVKQALAYLQQNYHQPVSREEIANAVNTNPSYLSRIFSQEVGISLWDFLARLRVEIAKEMLLNYSNSKTIIDIALQERCIIQRDGRGGVRTGESQQKKSRQVCLTVSKFVL